MSKREEFITVINTLKGLSSTITDEMRKGILQQAVHRYDLSIDEADEILKTSGLVVGAIINYFEVLGLSIEELQTKAKILYPHLLRRHIKNLTVHHYVRVDSRDQTVRHKNSGGQF